MHVNYNRAVGRRTFRSIVYNRLKSSRRYGWPPPSFTPPRHPSFTPLPTSSYPLKPRYRIALMHWAITTLCTAFRSFQPELPVTARPSRSRQKQNVDPGKLHRFTSNVGIAPLTDHHGWNGEVFPVSCGVNFMTSGFLYTSQSTFSFLISAVCRQKLLFLQKRQENAVTWCSLLIVTMLSNISCVI